MKSLLLSCNFSALSYSNKVALCSIEPYNIRAATTNHPCRLKLVVDMERVEVEVALLDISLGS
jgi:hypothetical protein